MRKTEATRRLRADVALIAALLALSALLLLFPRGKGETVTVCVDGETVAKLSLAEDCDYPVQTPYGYNLLTVRDGRAAIAEADCPGGDCLSGTVSRAGECLVCLPHRLLVRVDGAAEGAPDAVTGGRT